MDFKKNCLKTSIYFEQKVEYFIQTFIKENVGNTLLLNFILYFSFMCEVE